MYYLTDAKSKFNNNPSFYSKYHIVKSEIHLKNGEKAKALEELKTALHLTKQKFGDYKKIDIPIAHNEIGTILASQADYAKALTNYDLALKELSLISRESTFAIKIIKNKAHALNSFSNDSAFIQASEVVDRGMKILDGLKPTFKSETDKLFLIEDAFPLFELGLEASYELYKSIKDEEFIDKAFQYSEKSKSILLLEALLGSKATEFANIPEELLEKEKQFKAEITYLEKRLNNTQKNAKLEEKLFSLKNDYRNLVTTIETDYPVYYNLKYSSEVISLKETQGLLGTDEALISYFYGNTSIYTIVVTKDSKKLIRIPIDENLDVQITEIHGMMSDSNSDINVMARNTHVLYKSILKPAIDSLNKKTLIIVPDGLLNYIPFSALNTADVEISYLLENNVVSYVNSATLLRRLRHKESSGTNLLALAPSFNGTNVIPGVTRDALLPLIHNQKEIQRVLSHFNGRGLTGDKASLQNFTSSLSNDYGILHLATHAVFDDENPEYSFLAFSPDPNEEFLLYVRDLYNMKINAELVTLSACETGVGELKRGEGFMGLARGFFYGGASSITSTLWKVNDASSTELMDLFYKNMAQGDAKDIALRQAKIEFLKANSQNALKHPYYWSGFIISGNTSPLVSPNLWVWV